MSSRKNNMHFKAATISLLSQSYMQIIDQRNAGELKKSNESLSKSLYLAIVDIEKKWSGEKTKNWGIIYGQLKQIFEIQDLIISALKHFPVSL